MGYQQIGLMDIDNLYGAYEFLEECQKAGMGAVLGLDLEVEIPVGPLSIRLVALGTKGYKHLIKNFQHENDGGQQIGQPFNTYWMI